MNIHFAKLLCASLLCLAPALAAVEWTPIVVPTRGEMSGPGWLRCYIRVPDEMTSRAEKDLWSDSITLSLGDIRGPVSVWLNGVKIAETETLPAGERRRFKVPQGILETKVFNVLALRRYGAQGSTTTSRVTRPGVDAPDFPGVYREACMVWRYHPETKVYEIFAEGGGNAFELDFDSEGWLHSGHNGGETRGFHYMQSALLLKQGIDPGKFGSQANPFTFGFLDAMKTRNPIARFTHATIIADGTALPARYAGRCCASPPPRNPPSCAKPR